MPGGERRREAKGLPGKSRERLGITNDHVRAGTARHMKPEVALGRDLKRERVVVPSGPAHEDLHPVRRGETPRYLISSGFTLRELLMPGISGHDADRDPGALC
jgi:hypothetical protein